jgi:hypothetical protein
MNLLPIEPQPDGSAAANMVHIKCCHHLCQNPRNHISWNQAAKEEWTWDQEGEAYNSYYCKPCSDFIKTTKQIIAIMEE